MPKATKFYGLQVHDGMRWADPWLPGMRSKDDARKHAKAMLQEYKAVRLLTYTPTQTTLYEDK